MGACAVMVARAVDYVGAGTVEFLVSDVDRSFYFLEMNTRLQVEHPVTELVTGIDLVREQISVASGEPLSFSQSDVRMNGHAIECRIYAEDPDNNFIPSPGRISRLRVSHGPGVRDDGGVYEGAEVSIHYDPMISKFAAYGRDREEAIGRLRRALAEYVIDGIRTTLPFFREIVDDDVFIEGKLDTGFISSWHERRKSFVGPQQEKDMALIAAVMASSKKGEPAIAAAPSTPSKWANTGRIAALGSRT
jgi:acetyl-CoA carboxylase biotin carboxylase subunit